MCLLSRKLDEILNNSSVQSLDKRRATFGTLFVSKIAKDIMSCSRMTRRVSLNVSSRRLRNNLSRVHQHRATSDCFSRYNRVLNRTSSFHAIY